MSDTEIHEERTDAVSGSSAYHVNDKRGIASPDIDTSDTRSTDTDTLIDNSDTKVLLNDSASPVMDGWRDVNHSNYGAIQRVVSSQSISAEYERTADAEDDLTLLQAQVFLEDAVKYRSVDHKVDHRSLLLYRFYHSLPVSLLRYLVITLIHVLAFFEFPSSLSWSSDISSRGDRIHFPCGVTESIEFICLLLLIADAYIKSRIYGYRHLRSNKWLVVEMVCLFVSVVDWTLSISIGCRETVRVRRMLRPIFIIQNSSLMKKILNSLRKTLSQILGVLLLMGLHLFIFTLFAMLLFPKRKGPAYLHNSTHTDDNFIPSIISNSSEKNETNTDNGESMYFKTLIDSFMNLLVLLTTANNPDVTLPAYRDNRLAALFFIVFLIIGLYCFMNMLTAIIYNQFRGYFLSSMQSSLMRRRLGQRAAYESLKRKKHLVMNTLEEDSCEDETPGEVSVRDLKVVVSKAVMPRDMRVLLMQVIAEGFTQDQMITWEKFIAVLIMVEKQFVREQKPSIRWFRNYPKVVMFQKLICHRYFSYFGNLIALVNVVLIAIEVGDDSNRAILRIVNFIFILYYTIEQILLLLCMGWRRFRYHTSHILDLIIVLLLCVSEIVTVSLYGFPFFSETSDRSDLDLWNMVRVINILIMVRLLRIIWHIKAMAIVAHTLVDLVKNLQSFGGIIVVIYYSFAILGMELFQDKIKYNITEIETLRRYNTCGTYEQLDYWANNFDDFAAAIVVLWDVMVVNNWFVFLDAYAHYTNKVSYIYFIAWWLISVVLALNLFTALILENFIMKWDRYYEQISDTQQTTRSRSSTFTTSFSLNTLTVHDIFRPSLKEPSEDEIISGLKQLTFFKFSSGRPV